MDLLLLFQSKEKMKEFKKELRCIMYPTLGNHLLSLLRLSCNSFLLYNFHWDFICFFNFCKNSFLLHNIMKRYLSLLQVGPLAAYYKLPLDRVIVVIFFLFFCISLNLVKSSILWCSAHFRSLTIWNYHAEYSGCNLEGDMGHIKGIVVIFFIHFKSVYFTSSKLYGDIFCSP